MVAICNGLSRHFFLIPIVASAFPFRFINNRAEFRLSLVIYGLLLRLFFSLGPFLHVYKYLKNVKISETNGIYNIVLALSLILDYCFTVVSYICVIIHNKNIEAVLSSCFIFDAEMSKMGKFQLPKLNWLLCFMGCLIGLSPGVIRSSIDISHDYQSYYIVVYFFYLGLESYMSIDPFVRLVDLLRVRFIALSDIFLQVVNSAENRHKKKTKLDTIVNMYFQLSSTTKLLNKCFHIHLPFLYFMVFINIVTNVYYIIYSATFDSDVQVLVNLAKASISILFCMSGFLATYICNLTSREAKKFNNLVYETMMDSRSLSTHKLRLHISKKKQVIFTACGFFTIDNTLIHSIIAASTTYLVIVLQFGNKPQE